MISNLVPYPVMCSSHIEGGKDTCPMCHSFAKGLDSYFREWWLDIPIEAFRSHKDRVASIKRMSDPIKQEDIVFIIPSKQLSGDIKS
jgi:hypothetical protein